MKNNMKYIIGFITGVVITIGASVYAYSYFANDVSYIKQGTVNEISISDALNELYNRESANFASRTSANATANDIIKGKTAWVNGQQITGNANKLVVTTVSYQAGWGHIALDFKPSMAIIAYNKTDYSIFYKDDTTEYYVGASSSGASKTNRVSWTQDTGFDWNPSGSGSNFTLYAIK